MSGAKAAANADFTSQQITRLGVFGFLIDLIHRMTPIEAQLLLMGAASDRASAMPQAVLRDVIERYKAEQANALRGGE